MPSPHGGHTFDGVAGLPPRVRGHPMQRFNPRLLAFPPTRGFTLLMTTPTPVATPFSARTKIHLYHPSTAAFNVPFLHAHGDSSHQCQNRCTRINLSPRVRGFIRADSLPVLGVRPFSTCTGIRQPAAASHLGNVPFSTRTGIRAGTAREGSEPFLPQHTDTYSVAEAHGQTGSPFSAHMQSVSRLVHRSTFLIFSATHGPMRRPTLLPMAFPCMCTGDDGIPATHRRAKPCAHARAMPTHGRT